MNFGLSVLGQSRHRVSGPILVAHTAQQEVSDFASVFTRTSAIDTSGANFLVVVGATYDGGTGSPSKPALIADLVGGTVPDTVLSFTSITQSGSNMILNGTFPGGGSNAYAGLNFFVGGLGSSDIVDNGGYPCTASTTTTVTLTNPSGITTANSGKFIQTQNIWHFLIRQTDIGNSCMYYAYNASVGAGHTFLIDTVSLASDGGGLAVQAWSGIRHTSDPLVPLSYICTRGVPSATTASVSDITGTSLSGSNLTISGGWEQGTANAFVGQNITLSGYTGSSAVNNGTWPCTTSSSGSITVTVPGGFNGQAGSPKWFMAALPINTLIIAGIGGRNTDGLRSIDEGFTIYDSYSGSLIAAASIASRLSDGVTQYSPDWSIATSAININNNLAAFYHA